MWINAIGSIKDTDLIKDTDSTKDFDMIDLFINIEQWTFNEKY